jgi:hypothetical protein
MHQDASTGIATCERTKHRAPVPQPFSPPVCSQTRKLFWTIPARPRYRHGPKQRTVPQTPLQGGSCALVPLKFSPALRAYHVEKHVVELVVGRAKKVVCIPVLVYFARHLSNPGLEAVVFRPGRQKVTFFEGRMRPSPGTRKFCVTRVQSVIKAPQFGSRFSRKGQFRTRFSLKGLRLPTSEALNMSHFS